MQPVGNSGKFPTTEDSKLLYDNWTFLNIVFFVLFEFKYMFTKK